MSSLKRMGLTLILAALGFSACAVQTPSAEDIFPATKNSAVQVMYIAQFVRWATMTNASSSYTIDSFSIEGADYYVTTNNATYDGSSYTTNFYTIQTNLNEAVVNVTFDTDILPYQCNGTFRVLLCKTNGLEISHDKRTNVLLVNSQYTDFASFNTALSNAGIYHLSGTLYYTNGSVNITTSFASLEFEPSEGGNLLNSERNNYVEDSTIQFDTNLTDTLEMRGSYSNTASLITAQSGISMICNGTVSNDLELVSGTISAYYSTTDYSFNSWFQTKYTGNPTLDVSFPSVEKMDDQIFNFNLSNL